MNSQRNKSKSKRLGIYDDGLPGKTRAERDAARKYRADRIAATKKNSRKKTLRAKHAKPKETPELKAARASQDREATRKWLEKFMLRPAATKLAERGRLTGFVASAINDALIEEEKP